MGGYLPALCEGGNPTQVFVVVEIACIDTRWESLCQGHYCWYCLAAPLMSEKLRGHCSGVLAQWSCLRKARLEPWLACLVCPFIVAALLAFSPSSTGAFRIVGPRLGECSGGHRGNGVHWLTDPMDMRWCGQCSLSLRKPILSIPLPLANGTNAGCCVVGLPASGWLTTHGVCGLCMWKGAIACCVPDRRSCLWRACWCSLE